MYENKQPKGEHEAKRRSCRRLMIEAMVAAGPRKSSEEYREYGSELCEDCAGYRSVGDFIIFWVCDGTSDSSEVPKRSYLPGFNARNLAQDLGASFAKTMTEALENTDVPSTANLQMDVVDDVAQEWQKRLIEYIAEVKSMGKLEQFYDAMQHMIDGSYRLKWSSTFLGGVYNEPERTLDIVNIGDSGAVVVGEQSASVAPNKKRVILVATFSRDEMVEVDVSTSETLWEHYDGVECFIGLSDGVALDLEKLLYKLEDSIKSMSIDETRRRLLSRGELTYDDRSVIIGRLMPERVNSKC